jgi:hypothetical protein
MKKVVLGIFALAYLSGICTLVLGHFLQPSSEAPEVQVSTYFFDELESYPWVRHGRRFQNEKELTGYRNIVHLYSVDRRFGSNFLNAEWIKDYLTEEEAHILTVLVAVSDKDSEIAVNISQSTWFQKEISSDEVALMEKLLYLIEENGYVAKNVTSSNWFIITGTSKTDQVISTLMEMPTDLALAVSFAPWFKSDASLSWGNLLHELITLYSWDTNLAVNLPSLCVPQDFENLCHVNVLYAADRGLADQFFMDNTLSRESFLTLSDLSRIAAVDSELAHSFGDSLNQEDILTISFLADIYTVDPEAGRLAREKFIHDMNVLQYMRNVLQTGAVELEILEEGALFVSDNPEVICNDRIEPYRYHLLTEILSVIPPEKAQEYKDLIFVTCSVYGNRFYLWQNEEFNTRNGWAYDGDLVDQEKHAVIELLTFFIQKNDEGALIVDLRHQSSSYLYGLVDIPFTHLVNCDGTLVEAVYKEQGTGFVFATISNIGTLEQRFEKVHTQQQADLVAHTYTNPLVDVILEEGDKRDCMFVYFCSRNWETGNCTNHTLQTRMDSIVMGISTTTMHWTAPETAHIYPAYIPSNSISMKIQADPDLYGNPFVYMEFVAPYDEAGFRDSLDRDIEAVEIYDLQKEKKVNLFQKTERSLTPREKTLLLVVGVAAVFIGARALKK